MVDNINLGPSNSTAGWNTLRLDNAQQVADQYNTAIAYDNSTANAYAAQFRDWQGRVQPAE